MPTTQPIKSFGFDVSVSVTRGIRLLVIPCVRTYRRTTKSHVVYVARVRVTQQCSVLGRRTTLAAYQTLIFLGTHFKSLAPDFLYTRVISILETILIISEILNICFYL